jgi:GNAT superfamily N-acetyltransferase
MPESRNTIKTREASIMIIHDVSSEELDYVTAVCLDPSIPPKWREAMKPAMNVRKDWLKSMMYRGLQISVAFTEPKKGIKRADVTKVKSGVTSAIGGSPKALIEYVPIEFASEPVQGRKSLFINCMWVVPPFWHRDVGKTLLETAIDKGKAYGGISVLAYEGDKWFGFFPYMPAIFFKKFGFKEVDRDGTRVVLHLSLGSNGTPKLIHPRCMSTKEADKMVVDVFYNSQCPWSGWMADGVKQKMRKYGAVTKLINTDDREVVEKYGMSRGICINGEPFIKRMVSLKEIERIVRQVA